MKDKDYWNELKNIVKKDNWDYEKMTLLLCLLNDMHKRGANCDDCNTIDEGIKRQRDFEGWKEELCVLLCS